MSEKILSPGLPDIGARKSLDFLILTFSATTDPKELDTGAGVSVISQKYYEKYFSDLNISDKDF